MSSVRVGGVIFQVFPYDHGPRHVHGLHAGIEVIIELLDDRAVALADRADAIAPPKAKRSDVKKILKAARDHYDELVVAWEKMHP